MGKPRVESRRSEPAGGQDGQSGGGAQGQGRKGRALGLGSVRAVPVEPACGPGQRVVEEPWVGRRVKQSMIAEGFEKFVDRRVGDESVWWSWQR